MKKTQRKLIVLAGLVGVLSITSALLLALAPPPLSEAPSFDNLWAADGGGIGGSELTNAIFHTRRPAQQGHWKYIYIHQSGTPFGIPAGLGDHFVIGNGHGCIDGQIQMTPRWNEQTQAVAPPGARSIDPDCISICLIGDLDKSAPTALQTRRLAELVGALQGQLAVAGDNVFFVTDASAGSAGIGTRFPVEALRSQILP